MLSTLRAWETVVKTKPQLLMLYWCCRSVSIFFSAESSSWMWSIDWMMVFQFNIFDEIQFEWVMPYSFCFVSFMVMRRDIILSTIKWRGGGRNGGNSPHHLYLRNGQTNCPQHYIYICDVSFSLAIHYSRHIERKALGFLLPL